MVLSFLATGKEKTRKETRGDEGKKVNEEESLRILKKGFFERIKWKFNAHKTSYELDLSFPLRHLFTIFDLFHILAPQNYFNNK